MMTNGLKSMGGVHARRRQLGLTLLESLLALLILAVTLPLAAHLIYDGMQQVKSEAVAGQAREVAQAAKQYIQDNYSTVESASGASSPATITPAMLISTGYLPSSFGQGSSHLNPLGQSYEVDVTHPSGSNLQALLITKGATAQYTNVDSTRFANEFIPDAAAQIGADGGYIATGRHPGQTAGYAYSASGTWHVNPASMGVSSPGAGHLAVLMYFSNGTYDNDYLYRVSVPGQPQLNQMQTSLNMGGNDVNNAGEVQTSKGQKLSQAVDLADVVANGDLVPKPTCKSGESPQIFVTPVMYSDNNSGYPLSAVQTWASNYSATQWQVHIRVRTQNGYTYPNSTYGKLAAFTKCQ